jgi:uncharacterized repeat protein (TIGR01451 family)
MFNVHTHTVVVRNSGKAAATNVRLSHATLPQDFSVFPSVPFTVEHLQNGSADIVFPKLVSYEQVSIIYIYYPPLLFSQINTSCKSDEGFAKIVNVLWNPQPPAWRRYLSATLIAIGVVAIFVALVRLAAYSWGLAVAS